MLNKIVGTVLVMALSCAVALGAEYHVSPAGSDANDGGKDAPWATLQHAVDTVSPGDTIAVADGTYAGFRIRKSGTAAAPITIKAAHKAKACIDRPGPINDRKTNIEVCADNPEDGVSHWVIDGFETKNAPLIGVRIVHSKYITVRNCTAHDCGKVGIFSGFMWHCLWEDNTSYNNKQEGFYNSNSGDYNVIRNNYSHDNGSIGFHNNGDISMGGDGILSSNLIESNISARNGNTDLSFDGIEHSVVRNNLCYGTAKGIALYGIDAAIASRYNRVYNNTFVMPEDAYYAVIIRNHNPEWPDPVGNKLFNNIFYHRSGSETVGSICIDKCAEKDFESDYNVVVEHFGIDDNAQILTFARWQERGYDKHSLQASEADLFVDPGHDDYHLKAGSPAIDAGKTLEDVETDIEGTPRPQGAAYDIGCYEAKP